MPIDLLDNMIKAGATDEDLRLAKEEAAFYENERTPECKEFVISTVPSVAGVAQALLEVIKLKAENTYNKNQLKFLIYDLIINQNV